MTRKLRSIELRLKIDNMCLSYNGSLIYLCSARQRMGLVDINILFRYVRHSPKITRHVTHNKYTNCLFALEYIFCIQKCFDSIFYEKTAKASK